ncbi:MAG: ABC transporter permease [Actinobacteria bacterium]|nr:ABC transporter permease [Actinomycetota bacterium]
MARRSPLLAAGGALAFAIVVVTLAAPLIAPYPADAGTATHPAQALLAPSAAHLFGTDEVGRDLFTRVLYGGRVSLPIAAIVLFGSCLIGVPLGLIAGYFGGWIDEVVMRVTDVFLAFPPLLLSLALAAVLTPSVKTAVIAITATWWPWYVRLIRGQARAVGASSYVETARLLGVSTPRLLFRHVLPNCLTAVVVQVSQDLGGVILTAATLSFLGLGAQGPTPEWGTLVSEGQDYFPTQWWLVTFPGLAILIAAFAFNLLGDGTRDMLDPKAQVRRR